MRDGYKLLVGLISLIWLQLCVIAVDRTKGEKCNVSCIHMVADSRSSVRSGDELLLFISRPRSEGWPRHGRTFSRKKLLGGAEVESTSPARRVILGRVNARRKAAQVNNNRAGDGRDRESHVGLGGTMKPPRARRLPGRANRSAVTAPCLPGRPLDDHRDRTFALFSDICPQPPPPKNHHRGHLPRG